MKDGLFVFLGGGTGAVLRWWLAALLPAPWGTVVVNVIGSAVLAALLHEATALPEPWRLALGTGMMGGFTTYSTFNHDVLTALHRGEILHAALVAGTTLVACLGGAAVGWWLAARLGG